MSQHHEIELVDFRITHDLLIQVLEHLLGDVYDGVVTDCDDWIAFELPPVPILILHEHPLELPLPFRAIEQGRPPLHIIQRIQQPIHIAIGDPQHGRPPDIIHQPDRLVEESAVVQQVQALVEGHWRHLGTAGCHRC